MTKQTATLFRISDTLLFNLPSQNKSIFLNPAIPHLCAVRTFRSPHPLTPHSPETNPCTAGTILSGLRQRSIHILSSVMSCPQRPGSGSLCGVTLSKIAFHGAVDASNSSRIPCRITDGKRGYTDVIRVSDKPASVGYTPVSGFHHVRLIIHT